MNTFRSYILISYDVFDSWEATAYYPDSQCVDIVQDIAIDAMLDEIISYAKAHGIEDIRIAISE